MSKVSIVNRALALLGANRIINLSDETQEAKVASNMYDGSLRSLLSEAEWGFATKRANLNLTTVEPAWGGENVFLLPSDMVRLFKVNIKQRYTIQGNHLLTHAKGVGVEYVYKNEDDTLYPPYFIDALAARLAYDMCYDLTNSTAKQNELLELYQGQFLPIARHKNAADKSPVEVVDDAWVNSVYYARWD